MHENYHPLEFNEQQRTYFGRIKQVLTGTGAAAYRQAVIACTGSLPTWAKYAKVGRKPKASAAK